MKKILALFLMLSLMLTLISCIPNSDKGEDSETESESETETDKKVENMEQLEKNTYALNDSIDSLKLYGRMAKTDGGITCDFAASGIEFNVYAQGFVTLTVTHEPQEVENGSNGTSNKNDDVHLAVIVDGVADTREYKVPLGETVELKVAYFEEAGKHSIQILRKTEAKNGLLTLKSLTLVGSLEDAPENADFYIEFIGDSITSGYGNLITNGTNPAGDSDYKDATQAYAYLTAKALGADFQLVSTSGIGLTKGYRVMTMPEFFGAESYYRSATKTYAPARTPDLVVINLGTNDQGKGADITAFKNDVKTFIGNIRALYGEDVPVIWAYGMMSDGYISHVKEAIADIDNVYTVELPRNNEGGGGHPNVAAHKSAAEVLAEFIGELAESR